jgi:hypothetical protein
VISVIQREEFDPIEPVNQLLHLFTADPRLDAADIEIKGLSFDHYGSVRQNPDQ